MHTYAPFRGSCQWWHHASIDSNRHFVIDLNSAKIYILQQNVMNQFHPWLYLSRYTESKGIGYGKKVGISLKNSDLENAENNA